MARSHTHANPNPPPGSTQQVKILRGVSSLLRQARIDVVWAKGVELDLMPLFRRLQRDFLGDTEDGVPLQSSTTLFHSLRNAYVSALHALRHYWSADSARQLLQELSPDLEVRYAGRNTGQLVHDFVHIPSNRTFTSI